MSTQRRKFDGAFKTRVVMAALKGDRTMSELASAYGVHGNQIAQWRKQALEALPGVMGDRRRKEERDWEDEREALHGQIGELTMDIKWLKKSLALRAAERRGLIEWENEQMSVARQCRLVDLARSTLYYGCQGENEENLALMRLIDEQYIETPFFGVPRMTDWLRETGHPVNHKRVARLMQIMGLQSVLPRRRTSVSCPGHKVYPYLLRGLAIERPNQVWCADITYIRMRRGFASLVAVMDWFSRYVLAWAVSVTMDSLFCVDALERARRHGRPEIAHTDQGSQFTGTEYTGVLDRNGVRISMDGRGRVFDTIMIERRWRTVKYEHVYLHDHATVPDLVTGLGQYLTFDHTRRRHQSHGYRTPAQIYFSTAARQQI